MNKNDHRLQQMFRGKVPAIDHAETHDLAQYAHNCENAIGVVALPVGVAGPLLVQGTHAQGRYFAPLATTEACLVASVHRGAKAIVQAGGATTTVTEAGISRAPVFAVDRPLSKTEYATIIDALWSDMQASLALISRHTRLLRYDLAVHEQLVYVRLWFATGDAMGMNMATIATKYLSDQFLAEAFKGRLVATSSNWCSDKKPCHDHSTIGRKFAVTAQVVLSDEVLADLRVSAAGMVEVSTAKLSHGSALAGAQAANAHHANVIAGIYAATGQDLAHVVEGSHGTTTATQMDAGLVVSVHLPAVVCGTVGGGTRLPTQSQYLAMVQLQHAPGDGQQNKEFAEVIGAAVLAGEISLLAALCEHRLASAHAQFRST